MWYGHHPFGAGPYAYAGSLVTISQADEEWLPSIRRRHFLDATSRLPSELHEAGGGRSAARAKNRRGLGQSNRNDCRLLPGFASEP
jgi:hypothetical protein